jgi:hypothetical protein
MGCVHTYRRKAVGMAPAKQLNASLAAATPLDPASAGGVLSICRLVVGLWFTGNGESTARNYGAGRREAPCRRLDRSPKTQLVQAFQLLVQ